MSTFLAVGIAMMVALLSTKLMRLIKFPDVTAYLLAGLLIGPNLWKLLADGKFMILTRENVESINVLVSVALGFIAFSIGSEFKLSLLKRLGAKVAVITIMQAVGTVAIVFAALSIASLLGILGKNPWPIVFVLSALATATAPASTLMVVRQYKAHGPVTETLLPVVAMDDAIGLIVFSVFNMVALAFAAEQGITLSAMLLEPLREISLSLLIGALLGSFLALSTRWFKSRANRLCLCIMTTIIGIALSDLWRLSSLLLCMAVGAIFCNFGRDVDRVLEGTDHWTPPLFMLFFVVSGAELDLRMLTAVGALGAIYIVSRMAGKYFGARFGAFCVKADSNVRKYLGIALFPQAGVAVGMALIALNEFTEIGQSETGQMIQTVVLCATFIYEIVGPVLTKFALVRAGEIKKEKLSL